ncbi:LPXTG cell wall anchor domain-containing protein [Streptomyces sp. FIT100]|uniref:LPXTG cell wall anchor domain-containing protein n=1 Tax=Streptomyces sp. FIT100 TaxID=2837956 RepID=UPI0021C93F53|nr:LPXTG cell wall anchor domain-containing protein [Streptomyces sp. FIT100]
MKLRRAMAVAAATAVIAPAAFLAAPAAYATDGTTSTTSTAGSTGESETPAEGTTPAEETPAEETKPGEETPAEETKPEEETPAEETKPEEETPAEGTNPEEEPPAEGTNPGEEPPAEGTDPGEDEELPPYCEEIDENFEEKALDVEISGLPGKIVAGSAPEEFNLTITNKSEADLKEVAFYAEVENYELDEDKYLSKYVDLEFKLPGTNEWAGIGDKDWAGGYFWGVETMKSQDFVKIDLRLTIDKNAPAGDSYSFGSGGYLGDVEGQECIAENEGQIVDFVVLAPGSSNENPGEAKPGEGDQKPGDKGPDTKPQGGIKEIPVSGNLAETGSSSMLPTIGIAGGIAIVAGAGVVFAMKRRKGAAVA